MRIHPLGFELIELGRNLSDKEMDEMVAIIRTSLANEWMFQLRIRDLSYDKQDAWIREFWLNDCLTEPRFRNFAIRDLSAGYEYPVIVITADNVAFWWVGQVFNVQPFRPRWRSSRQNRNESICRTPSDQKVKHF